MTKEELVIGKRYCFNPVLNTHSNDISDAFVVRLSSGYHYIGTDKVWVLLSARFILKDFVTMSILLPNAEIATVKSFPINLIRLADKE